VLTRDASVKRVEVFAEISEMIRRRDRDDPGQRCLQWSGFDVRYPAYREFV